MLNLQDFLSSTPPDLLREYFARVGVDLPESPPCASMKQSIGPLLDLVDGLQAKQRQTVMDDADRFSIMAREDGEAALYNTARYSQQLDGLPNSYARAVWLFVYDRDAWDLAEQNRFNDERRFGRAWDGYAMPKHLEVARDSEAISAFEAGIAEAFRSPNVEVEVCDRLWTEARGRKTPLVQAAIFLEGRKGERRAFVGGRLDRIPDLPVREAAVAYAPATGALEVVASTRPMRDALVRLFAEKMLGAAVNGERLPVRQYQLDHLRQPQEFGWDVGDGIEDVKVTLLRLMPLDAADQRITLECMRGASRSIWDMAEERFGDNNPLLGGHRITQARLRIRFTPRGRGGGHGRRTVPVLITMPNGCDLKSKTSTERLIGEKYLERWGLLRNV